MKDYANQESPRLNTRTPFGLSLKICKADYGLKCTAEPCGGIPSGGTGIDVDSCHLVTDGACTQTNNAGYYDNSGRGNDGQEYSCHNGTVSIPTELVCTKASASTNATAVSATSTAATTWLVIHDLCDPRHDVCDHANGLVCGETLLNIAILKRTPIPADTVPPQMQQRIHRWQN